MILLNPKKITKTWSDSSRKEIMLKTIEFFEKKGLKKITEDDHGGVWYRDFINFCQDNQVYYKIFTPTAYGDGKTRWDTSQNTEFAEILGFYGLMYWYTFQVSALGLGPIFIGKNAEVNIISVTATRPALCRYSEKLQIRMNMSSLRSTHNMKNMNA